jgi:hypothetical protein
MATTGRDNYQVKKIVMAGLVPAIQVSLGHRRKKDVDARDEPGHDGSMK